MTLPHLATPSIPRHHRSALTQWIHEWNLLKALHADPLPEQQPAPPPAPGVAARDSVIARGEIRLIHPSIEPSAVRYVAVLGPHTADTWRIVPFGRLSEPATPDEIRTDRTTPALRVLSAWNQCPMPAALLQRCWRVGPLSAVELTWLTDTPPVDRVGPPLRHPLDPRWDYLEMESEFRHRICKRSRGQVTYEIPYPTELRKAAEESLPYGTDDDDETATNDTHRDV